MNFIFDPSMSMSIVQENFGVSTESSARHGNLQNRIHRPNERKTFDSKQLQTGKIINKVHRNSLD